MSDFKDYFSAQSAGYAKFRPTYPEELFVWIADVAPRTARVWDCATGNGQAAAALANHFDRVDATDASADQIARAHEVDRVHFAVGSAEASGLPADAFDAITVATAYHWFDHAAFAREARRVGLDDAVVIVWTYSTADLPPAARAVVTDIIENDLATYFPPELSAVWKG
ncbi:MAG: class I SAM-dependent methyltransferase, partial [Halobacteriales archaeon]|nr:class I SAM-dependent methyltransferase [Halobacteriales archaeon]